MHGYNVQHITNIKEGSLPGKTLKKYTHIKSVYIWCKGKCFEGCGSIEETNIF